MLMSLTSWGFLLLVTCVVAVSSVSPAPGNGILTCHPGVRFFRDCGNECVCHEDGNGAECTSRPCPKDFEISMRDEVNKVFAHMDKLRSNGKDPVFTCVPRTYRRINESGGTCFCSSNGKAEICSQHPGSPWGI